MKRTLKRESKVLEIVGGEALEAGRLSLVGRSAVGTAWTRCPLVPSAPRKKGSAPLGSLFSGAEPLRVRPWRRAGVGWPGGRRARGRSAVGGNSFCVTPFVPAISGVFKSGRGISREHTPHSREGGGGIGSSRCVMGKEGPATGAFGLPHISDELVPSVARDAGSATSSDPSCNTDQGV
jgi:hypothetical protein